jgi:hypothetical protein
LLHLRRRLQKLECRRREEQWFALVAGEARRLLEEKLDAISSHVQAARDCGEYEEPNVTVEQVEEMLYAYLGCARKTNF